MTQATPPFPGGGRGFCSVRGQRAPPRRAWARLRAAERSGEARRRAEGREPLGPAGIPCWRAGGRPRSLRVVGAACFPRRGGKTAASAAGLRHPGWGLRVSVRGHPAPHRGWEERPERRGGCRRVELRRRMLRDECGVVLREPKNPLLFCFFPFGVFQVKAGFSERRV